MAKKKAAARKPRGFGAFDTLTRKLVQVPKEEVDAQVERSKRERMGLSPKK